MLLTRPKRRHPIDERPGSSLEDDRGTTIVEVIVATLVLGIGITGATALLVLANETTAATSQRATASNIGVAELELIRSWPYDEIGISPGEPAYVPVVDGARTVTEAGRNRVLPRTIEERNQTSYEIRRHVTWAAIGTGGPKIEEGYKVVVVIVSWSDEYGDHEVRSETGVFSDGQRG